ncbi:hypothetical protein E2C01_007310 [Portunus trituberculatus]|uniref:Uncharacterized protein n=1 Tax=Portunus trituberculatus TaxID=210409 RepID=A0A5B7CXU8_PORTR|nr:hypothetical protein [Portunus trituberculatus]
MFYSLLMGPCHPPPSSSACHVLKWWCTALGQEHSSNFVTPCHGRDVALHDFALFRNCPTHTSIYGQQLWRAITNPCHRVARLCQDLCTQVTVAELRAVNHIPNVAPQHSAIFRINKLQ